MKLYLHACNTSPPSFPLIMHTVQQQLSSSEISRLVEHMVPVSSDTLALEDLGEAQVSRHLVLRDDIICAFRLTNDKFTNLRSEF